MEMLPTLRKYAPNCSPKKVSYKNVRADFFRPSLTLLAAVDPYMSFVSGQKASKIKTSAPKVRFPAYGYHNNRSKSRIDSP